MKLKDFLRPFTRMVSSDHMNTTIRFVSIDGTEHYQLVTSAFDVEKNEWVINLRKRTIQ